MKKIVLTFTAIVLSAAIANAFPETSSFNTLEMQQIQHLQYNTRNDYDNVQNFKERKEEREQRAKMIEERQKRLEERAEQPLPTNSQFVNDNGTIRIENK